jgi:uncharacterized spore protein YtfJ
VAKQDTEREVRIMSETLDKYVESMDRNQQRSVEMMEKLLSAAQPSAVYGKPVDAEGYTIITASEVVAGGGFGSGGGVGITPEPPAAAESDEEEPAGQQGGGGGGGGGGGSSGRPVAVIIIGPEGVEVEPVVDATKIALAFFTALGAILTTLFRIRRAAMGR